ncbi:MAG TPA: CTP synthase (glutamine hydrolyzing) [Candidatus Nanoarchaeia archaeon]|nr:CTP synthase (glutamine hydrolyzing) [Candidatus Nanoarchaeia archaeon]
MRTKYIVVTGGVLSGLGKGIVSASILRLISPYYKVVPVKCDGYLNVDPGTMNPIEHGEVFVLDDGGEVDLDFGHYERFLNTNCKSTWNLTSGKVFSRLMEKERKGDFLGKTVQVIPHVTGEIRQQFKEIIKKEQADILLIEVGGTVGDLENLWFLEALRELQREVAKDDIIFIHLGLVPVIDSQGQQKTKPLQQSILFLRERGIMPDVLIGRSKDSLTPKTKQKLEWLTNVRTGHVLSDPDLEFVYELPLIFEKERMPEVLARNLNIKVKSDLRQWKKLVYNLKHPQKNITIAICGKYTELADSYLSIMEALAHAGAHLGVKVHPRWVETTDVESDKVSIETLLTGVQGVIVPGGFGSRGVEGKIKVIEYVRKNNIPFLGICYGMQLAVIEYARNVCGLIDANSTEVKKTQHPVIDFLPEQLKVIYKGGTMRLGGHDVLITRNSRAHLLFKKEKIRQRFRHRYEVNPSYVQLLEQKGLVFSGRAATQPIMQVLELPKHKYFMACQFHPELTSRLERPHELFVGLVRAGLR